MEKDVAKGTVNCDGNLWKDKHLAHVKLPVLKLVLTLKSFNMPMVQGLQWFLRTHFSSLLSQQEEQQSSSDFQIHTSLDACESFNNPWRVYFMSQSVLALSWFNSPSRAREQIPETGKWDGGKDAPGALHLPECCWKVWEGTESLLGRDPSFSQIRKDSSKQT